MTNKADFMLNERLNNVAYVTHKISLGDNKNVIYRFYDSNDNLLKAVNIPIIKYSHKETLIFKKDLPLELRKILL